MMSGSVDTPNPAQPRKLLSIVLPAYNEQAVLPETYARFTAMSERLDALGMDYELVFVNDGSPDDSEEVIRAISASNPHVLGITHSRNFGSQAAFRSGMELAAKNAVITAQDNNAATTGAAVLLARWLGLETSKTTATASQAAVRNARIMTAPPSDRTRAASSPAHR